MDNQQATPNIDSAIRQNVISETMEKILKDGATCIACEERAARISCKEDDKKATLFDSINIADYDLCAESIVDNMNCSTFLSAFNRSSTLTKNIYVCLTFIMVDAIRNVFGLSIGPWHQLIATTSTSTELTGSLAVAPIHVPELTLEEMPGMPVVMLIDYNGIPAGSIGTIMVVQKDKKLLLVHSLVLRVLFVGLVRVCGIIQAAT